jgi:ABC-2 type transport system permease protein
MNWQKIWLVARREYIVNFARRGFLFTAFVFPLLFVGGMYFLTRFIEERETSLEEWQNIGYIDQAGVLSAEGPNPDDYLNLNDRFATLSEQNNGPIAEDVQTYAVQRLREGDLDAFFVINENYVVNAQVDIYAQSGTPEALRRDVENFIGAHLVAGRAQRVRVSTADGERVTVPSERLSEGLDTTLHDVDTDEELTLAAIFGRIMLPFVFVFIYFLSTNTTSQYIMGGVVEEKENRLMEILATSLRPFELLSGKVLGLSSLALTQVFFWTAAALTLALFNDDAREFIQGADFTLLEVGYLVLLFIFNFLLFSSVMMAIGASVTAEAESRQIAGMFTFVNVFPLILSGLIIAAPDGILAVALTLFPPTTATTIALRIGITSIPFWQLVAGILVQIIGAMIVLWLAARIFRLGMLMYGKPLTPRMILQALSQGANTPITSAEELNQPGGQSA